MDDTQAGSVSISSNPVQISQDSSKSHHRIRISRGTGSSLDMITLEIISDIKKLASLKDDWECLVNRCTISEQNRCFQENIDTLKALTKQDNTIEPTILIGRHEGKVVMIWPLIKLNVGGICQLKFIPHKNGSYSSLLLSEHPSRMAWLERSFMFLISSTECDSIHLEHVRKQSLLLAFLQRKNAYCFQNRNHFSYDCFFSHSLLGQAYNGLLQGQMAATKLYGYVRSACLSVL